MIKQQKFPKAERLTGVTHFTQLAEQGSQLFAHPLKMFWRKVDEQETLIRVAVVAPKRLFKKAPDRNYIKRKMREAYRTQKEPFLTLNNNLHLLWVYISKNPNDVAQIPQAMQKLALKLKNELNNKME